MEKLAKRLARVGVKATSIHGDRTQGQRNRALAGFQQGDYRVLVATDVAARGIHVDGISHVVNFDLPMVPEDFIHREPAAPAGAMPSGSAVALGECCMRTPDGISPMDNGVGAQPVCGPRPRLRQIRPPFGDP
ncbi:MAG: C-terminal helicase domain-containing protein [Bryobacterales bacterium]|nr:C-terminal helicase domain-containing protein [Bryobacterales bacterium]